MRWIIYKIDDGGKRKMYVIDNEAEAFAIREDLESTKPANVEYQLERSYGGL